MLVFSEIYMELKIGDIVELKSGGPKMTIEDITSDIATCRWFKGNDLCSKNFLVALLTRRNPEDLRADFDFVLGRERSSVSV